MADNGEKTEGLQDTDSKDTVEMLEPGKNIRPIMTEDQARELVQRLFGMEVGTIVELVLESLPQYFQKINEVHVFLKRTCLLDQTSKVSFLITILY